jgi:hypothetical protein
MYILQAMDSWYQSEAQNSHNLPEDHIFAEDLK